MKALIFGIYGSIGNFIAQKFHEEGIECIGTTSKKNKVKKNIIFVDNKNYKNLETIENLDIIIWCQGYNINDNINTYNNMEFNNSFNINVLFIVDSLNILINNNSINNNSNLIIVSSIWEKCVRDNKLSYSVSKSSLSGLVKSLSYDLSSKNILINNICPGVIDNEMSKKTLSEKDMNFLKEYTHFNRMVTLNDIYITIKFFSLDNTAITGQSINVDLGFTNIRKYT